MRYYSSNAVLGQYCLFSKGGRSDHFKKTVVESHTEFRVHHIEGHRQPVALRKWGMLFDTFL